MTRIVSKREVALWVTIVVGALLFAFVLAMAIFRGPAAAASPAQKLPDKHVVFKSDTWSSNRLWVAPNHTPPGTHIEEVKNSVTTTYLFWPDGGDIGKIAITNIDVCYDLYDAGDLFQGLNANPYYQDDNDVLNPGAIEVPDNGDKRNCTHYTVPVSSRKWFRMGQDPAWFVTGKIRLKFTNDDDYHFKWAGNEVKYFHPGDDPNIGEYFNCECDYGQAGH